MAAMEATMDSIWVLFDDLLAATTRARASPQPARVPDLRSDAVVCCFLTVVFFALNWGIRLFLITPFLRSVIGMGKAASNKCSQSAMEALIYGSFSVLGLCVVPSQAWVWPSSLWWIGFDKGEHAALAPAVHCYYIMYTARYIQQGISVLLEPKRKDFVEMLVHHAVSVFLAITALYYGFNRVGAIMMFMLDPADVFLHLAKVCKYLADASQRYAWQWMADRFFEVFAVSFFVTRLILYGYVVWSASWETWHLNEVSSLFVGIPHLVLLYVLLFLQVYWMALIMKVAVRILCGRGCEDPRSDDEDEGGEEADPAEDNSNPQDAALSHRAVETSGLASRPKDACKLSRQNFQREQ